MAKDRDFYSMLGVSRDASADEIKSAYRKLARKLHPDVNKEPDAAEKFNEVQRAYDTLGDPDKRKQYDRVGHQAFVSGAAAGAGARGAGPGGASYTWSSVGGPGFGGATEHFDASDIGSIFEEVFGMGAGGGFGAGPGAARGRARARPARGRDITADIRIPFDTAIHGGTQSVRVQRGGATQTIDVKIPKGVADGAKLRIRGSGEPSPGAGAAGDLILTIHVSAHPLYRREGQNIVVDLPLTIVEAALGATIKVPTPWGPVDLKVPAGSSSGARLRIRGRGVRTESGEQGDFFAVLKIAAPQSLSDEDREALERIGERLPSPRKGPEWDT